MDDPQISPVLPGNTLGEKGCPPSIPRTDAADDFWNQQLQLLVTSELASFHAQAETDAGDFWNQQLQLLMASEPASLYIQLEAVETEQPPGLYRSSDDREKIRPKQRFSIRWLVLCGLLVLAPGLWVGRFFLTPLAMRSTSSIPAPPALRLATVASSDAWLNAIPTIPDSWDHSCPSSVPQSSDLYTIVGAPDLSVAFINKVLAYYHSPAAGLGQQLYDATTVCGIKPGVGLAFFMHESGVGTTGEARVTLSLGNSRCITGYKCIDQDRGGYAAFPSWQTGFAVWGRMMRNLYVAQWGLVTIDQVIPTYAPNADHNNEQEYIASLKHILDTWRAGEVQV